MATAQETVLNVVFLNSNLNTNTTVYTVPAGRIAEVYVQKILNGASGGFTSNIKIGEVAFGPDNPVRTYQAQGLAESDSLANTSMTRVPILLDQGQVIKHTGVTSPVFSTVVAVIKEFNRP